ncbi:hypothetical protein [Flammeovirga kamogawensis]|uniref:DUF2383 domain-containing protein n=1 Tax=Flammeovirga kamogawensis TaxID=373891 RepID=A0ABX8H1E9_9BACT|nr:hypothetical protein [Flammeovirga kamogawensis]MBB6462598.1 hypothetical protein [Flammeovirga kamogawensis]QWG09656.1 hypothetical protein KM029_23930 [Flammeovirga kamogawensis]TRX65170.1 hypothetical protein EO216_21830 [Flammeovirga kamogawensis]
MNNKKLTAMNMYPKQQKEQLELITFCKNSTKNAENYLVESTYYNLNMMLNSYEHLYMCFEDYLLRKCPSLNRQQFGQCNENALPQFDYDGKRMTLECSADWVSVKVLETIEKLEKGIVAPKSAYINHWKVLQLHLQKTRALVKGLRKYKHLMPTKGLMH